MGLECGRPSFLPLRMARTCPTNTMRHIRDFDMVFAGG